MTAWSPAWVLWFEDPSVGPLAFAGEGAEEAAKKAYESASGNWSVRLFVEVDPA